MSVTSRRARTVRHRISAVVGLSALLSASLVTASPASADPGPVQQRTAAQVTADALPTVQVDGVVWTQATVGNTVYAGGNFSHARPAGAAPGVNQVNRGKLLAYNITTGVLVASFAPSLNNQVRAIAASPDGSRLYVAGDFTAADGHVHNRIAAYSTATGVLLSTFTASIDNGSVKSLTATATAVYAGGSFTSANGNPRSRIAAFAATTGALLAWNPGADATVQALVATPDKSAVIAGGAFQNIAGQPAYGLASLDAATGTQRPFAANQRIRDAGPNAAILSLSTDGTSIFGSGYVFGVGGNLEGSFSANPTTGAVNWVEDCHGDTYSTFGSGSALYIVSHSHYCGNVGGFPETDVRTSHRALAFTTNATGTLKADRYGYFNWQGTPAPSQINWYPDLVVGPTTGQAAWSVTGNSQYVALGGEFPSVNGTAQQGLVRFAVSALAPDRQGPRVSGASFVPNITTVSSGTAAGSGSARVAFQANWDRDDTALSYSVVRDAGKASTRTFLFTANSTFWNRPYLGFTDTGLDPGSTHTYRVYVSDADGSNKVAGNTVSYTVPAAAVTPTLYSNRIVSDGATSYWPLNEPAGTIGYDNAKYNDLTVQGATRSAARGMMPGLTQTIFAGTSASTAYTNAEIDAPNVLTVSAWINTTSTHGGKIVGFGSAQTGLSNNYDRQIWMDNAGLVHFGVWVRGPQSVSNTVPLNNGQWHQLVATLGPNGLALYVDGALTGSRSDVTVGSQLTGYWRIGGDNVGAWTPLPTSYFFAGSISAVAVLPTVLSAAAVSTEYHSSGR